MLNLLLLSLAAAAPHELGHTTVTWNDPNQGGKAITAEVWYPADVAGDDVPVAAAPAYGFPVLSMGHGFLMVVERYRYLWEALVPQGYVMVLTRTEGGVFPDHLAMARDMAFLIQRLELEGDTPGSLFEGAIGDRSCVMGHSMGGGASVLAASIDASIEAVCNLAAAETNPSAIAAAADVHQPTLMLAGTDDCVTPIDQHQRPIHQALAASCALLVTLDGATHCQFALPDFFCSLGELCSGPMGEAEQHAATLALVEPWLDATLKQDGDAWDEFSNALNATAVAQVEGTCHDAGGPLRYCSSTTNSSGEAARIHSIGSVSVQQNDFTLRASAAPVGKLGLFLYGADVANVPFMDGTLCISAGGVGIFRLDPVVTDADGKAQRFVDFTAPPAGSGPGQVLPGTQWFFQFWFRDLPAMGTGSNLSDGLRATFEP